MFNNQNQDQIITDPTSDVTSSGDDLTTNLNTNKETSPLFQTTDIILSVRNVSKSYKRSKQKINALNGVSIDVRRGEILALTGASGSGKSTLLQLMGGLDKPTNGTIEVDGLDLSKLSDARLSTFRNQTIGFVFQSFYLQPFLRLNKNVEVPSMFAHTKRDQRRGRIHELMARVGLDTREDSLPKEISGGQLQRAAVARALINNPKILLADEPTGNLDSVNSEGIIDLFEEIRKEFGTTIIIVTHNQEIAARADRQLVMSDGVFV